MVACMVDLPRPGTKMTSNDLLQHQKIDEFYKTIRTAIRTVGYGVAAFFAWKSIEALAGEDTSVLLSLLGDFKFSFTITLAGAAAAWAVVERIIRQNTVERLQGRIRQFELVMDPNRTSSELTPKGKTNNRDKDT